MATTNNLKFFHVTSWPEAGAVTGGIYFNKTTGEIAVWNGTDWEKYSGIVKSVVWSGSPANDSGSLVITNFDNKSTTIDFSDVASKKDVIDRIATALQSAKTYSDAKKINGLTGPEITLTGADVALTGYKKAETSSAITATDTVNTALGKLEKAIEATGGDALTHITAGNGIDVTNKADHNQTISVKIDTASENFLTAGADGLKLSGVQNAIDTAINNLDSPDEAVDNQYVSSVSETNGKIAVKRTNLPVIGVADGDKILSLSSSKIGAGLSIEYNSTDKKIYLYGSEKDEAHKIGEVDCTDFIKDGMLDNATYDPTSHNLTLTFNTASGKEAIDVDLSKLVDTYKAGEGLALVTTDVDHPTFKINLDNNSSYLTIVDGKLRFDDTTLHTKITGDINTKVNALNATKSNATTATHSGSEPSSQIKVEVSEAAGVLTGVTVTAPVFAKPSDITAAETKLIGSNSTDTKSSDTIWGAKKYADDKATAAQTNAESYTDEAIQALDATVDQAADATGNATGLALQVVQENGKLKSVSGSMNWCEW